MACKAGLKSCTSETTIVALEKTTHWHPIWIQIRPRHCKEWSPAQFLGTPLPLSRHLSERKRGPEPYDYTGMSNLYKWHLTTKKNDNASLRTDIRRPHLFWIRPGRWHPLHLRQSTVEDSRRCCCLLPSPQFPTKYNRTLKFAGNVVTDISMVRQAVCNFDRYKIETHANLQRTFIFVPTYSYKRKNKKLKAVDATNCVFVENRTRRKSAPHETTETTPQSAKLG